MDVLKTNLNTFVRACERLQAELAKFGIEIDSFSENARLKLEKTPLEVLVQITASMEGEIERFSQLSSCEESKNWEYQQLWGFLKENKFKFSNDLFSRVEDGCFLEVYGMNSKAVYRSPNFYRITSYSIGDLFLYTWNELFLRPDAYVLQIVKSLYDGFDSSVGSVLDIEIPAHDCTERDSPKKMKGQAKLLFLSAVENQMGVKHLITANKVTGITPTVAV